MATGLLTPLQLTTGAALLNNSGIALGRDINAALNSYNQTTVISAWQDAVNYALGWAAPSTIAQLLTIGASVCAALGNSIPTGAPTPRPITGPVNTGFSGLIRSTGNLYLGNGDIGKFAQAFFAASSYCSSINLFINSSVNAQTYLGPTFKNMNELTTNSISSMSTDLTGFGVDLGNQGQLTNTGDLDNYGTPAALLKQISKMARIQSGTLQIIETPMLAVGLTVVNIKTLLTGNRDLDPTTFDRYQSLAYTAMTRITGNDLQQILNILDVTTPNIGTLADLLDQQKIFPNSWKSLTTTTTNGVVPVYLDDGSVGPGLSAAVSAYLPTPSGCDELGKIIPSGMAVANKAVQVAFQQVSGISNSTLPSLAETVLGQTQQSWDVEQTYLSNEVVRNSNLIPTFYRAQQNVPVGTDINNTDYWKPTTLGGISTMAGLPDIENQTKALPDNVASAYQSFAVGSGPNGTIVIGDVLGAAAGYGYTDRFVLVTANINSLYSAGALTNLVNTYIDMLSAMDDSALLVLIAQANSDIVNIAAANSTTVATINSAWSAMATNLNKEYLLQQQSAIVWADLPANSRTSVMSLIQSLPGIGLDVAAGGTGWYFDQISDTSTQGGQASVATMRESRNNQRLDSAQLGVNTTPSISPAVTPTPVVVSVN
jgi:hypothetical protein